MVQSCRFKGSRLLKPIHVQLGEAIQFFFDATPVSVLVVGVQAHSVIQRKSVQMDTGERELLRCFPSKAGCRDSSYLGTGNYK